MNAELSEKKCMPCQDQESKLEQGRIEELAGEIEDGWEVVDNHHLHRTFRFDDFQGPLDFVNQIGEIAEDQGHHPDICLTYGKVDVKVWTHKVDGLSENDFIFASKVDKIK